MTFNSLQFAAFFCAVWTVVWALSKPNGLRLFVRAESRSQQVAVPLRNGFLLAASYVFYGAWDYRFLGLLWLSTLLDFSFGRLMGRPEDHSPRRRRAFITASVVMNLSILGFFKYFGFFSSNFAALAHTWGWRVEPFVLHVVLPVGVSFYTFQSLSYTIDVYRGVMPPARSLLNFATFIAFFPQLVAGPIERAVTLLPQIEAPTLINAEDLSEGAFLIAAGVFKKVVIADNVAEVVRQAFYVQNPTGLQAWMGAYAFAVQIYCDFSGYTDIARGTARCLGFRLMLNFDLPYFASNPSDFWRRWHISLSTWLRDYLYIPLGGNRGSRLAVYRNLMLTMLLGGLWHGAAWTFIAWGAFHGALLCGHRLVGPVLRRAHPAAGWGKTAYTFVCRVAFFHVICVSWIFFRAEDLTRALHIIRALGKIHFDHLHDQLDPIGPLALTGVVSGLLFGFQVVEFRKHDLLAWLHVPTPVRTGVYAVGALLFLMIGEYGGHTFIYFQF